MANSDLESVNENLLKGYTNKKIVIKEKKKNLDNNLKDLLESKKENKIVIGTDRTIKLIKKGNINKVYISKNINETTKKKLYYYSKISPLKIIELNYTSSELGEKLEKPFIVSVVGVLS